MAFPNFQPVSNHPRQVIFAKIEKKLTKQPADSGVIYWKTKKVFEKKIPVGSHTWILWKINY